MTLAARLVRQTGAAFAVAWCERLPRGRGYVVRVLPLAEALPAPPAGGAVDDGADAALINRALEAVIRQRPAQYLWGYARYKPPRTYT
jgi:KDO2-lipid IV(A) lauroyltransferase